MFHQIYDLRCLHWCSGWFGIDHPWRLSQKTVLDWENIGLLVLEMRQENQSLQKIMHNQNPQLLHHHPQEIYQQRQKNIGQNKIPQWTQHKKVHNFPIKVYAKDTADKLDTCCNQCWSIREAEARKGIITATPTAPRKYNICYSVLVLCQRWAHKRNGSGIGLW